MTEILVTFYFPSGKFRQACVVDVGDTSLAQEDRFKQMIVDRQTCLGIGWQGYYYVHTDLVKSRTEWYRGFHSKIFRPDSFADVGEFGKKPWKWVKNMDKDECRLEIETSKDELKMGEPRQTGDKEFYELNKAGKRGLYGRGLN